MNGLLGDREPGWVYGNGKPKGHGRATLAGGICSAVATSAIYRSILNPIFSLTWNSSTLPSLILPLASAIAAFVASAKLTGDVPTSSVILYVAAMSQILLVSRDPQKHTVVYG